MSDSIRKRIIVWSSGRNTGESSMCMANWLAFGLLINQGVAPLVPSDFGKCLELLEIVPELRDKLHDLSQVSAGWAALIARWQEVETMFLTEVGLGWHKALVAPKTCQLMREIYDG